MMANVFSIRPRIIAGSAFVLFVFLLDFSGKRTSGDEQTIRRLRADFNNAIAAHDANALPKFWREEIHVTTGAGRQLAGRAALRAAFDAIFADATFISYTRSPNRVELSESGLRAAESGHWLGQWKKPDGTMEWRGTYLAMWRKENGQWLIQSELYVSLKCSGSKECSQ
jgi:ketosteroid isomerase-like protein